jgi:hypothetical protein
MLSEGDNPNFDSFILDSNIRVEEYSYAESIINTRVYQGRSDISDAKVVFYSNNRLLQKGEKLFIFDCVKYPSKEDYITWNKMKRAQLSINTVLRKGVTVAKVCRKTESERFWQEFFKTWIPLAFCGDVRFFMLNEDVPSFIQKTLLASNRALCFGECFPDAPMLGRVALTKNQAALNYYKQEADYLLSKCSVMIENIKLCNTYRYTMDLFNRESPRKAVKVVDNFFLIFGISEELFRRVSKRVHMSDESIAKIKDCWNEIKHCVELLDKTYKAEIYITEYKTGDNLIPMPIFSDAIGGDVFFSPEEYNEACKGLERFIAEHPNMLLRYIRPKFFKHLRFIFSEKWTLISREDVDSRQIIVRDKKQMEAIESIVI